MHAGLAMLPDLLKYDGDPLAGAGASSFGEDLVVQAFAT